MPLVLLCCTSVRAFHESSSYGPRSGDAAGSAGNAFAAGGGDGGGLHLGRGGHAVEIGAAFGDGRTAGGLGCRSAEPGSSPPSGSRRWNARSGCSMRISRNCRPCWRKSGNPPIDGILADLGISTNQLFDPAYGLSFDRAMPLDMRLDPRLPENAADLVNKLPEERLANVLYELAQERWSRQIARKIVESAAHSPIRDTEALAELVRSAIPRRGGASGADRSGHENVFGAAHGRQQGDEQSPGVVEPGTGGAGCGGSDGGDQLPVDGRSVREAGVSVVGADRGRENHHEKAPLPHPRRNRP